MPQGSFKYHHLEATSIPPYCWLELTTQSDNFCTYHLTTFSREFLIKSNFLYQHKHRLENWIKMVRQKKIAWKRNTIKLENRINQSWNLVAMCSVHAFPMIDQDNIGRVSNWICLSNFLAQRDWYLLAISCRNGWKIRPSRLKFFANILLDSYSIMEKCLLFTFPAMTSTEGWNIWWSTWPNKLCNYPLVFVYFYFALFFARKPFSLLFCPCACGYLITSCAMKRKGINSEKLCSLLSSK